MEERVHLALELESAGDPISGCLRDGNGDVTEFSGWLQLTSAIEAARAGSDPPAGAGAVEARQRGDH